MPVSAPPPSWNKLLNKPTTVEGFGISNMATQSVASAVNATNATNATNVSNVTTQQVINATAGATAGSVGTYANAPTANTSYAVGATVAGSNLTIVDGATGGVLTFPHAGTWRNMGGGRVGNPGYGNAIGVFLRIA